MPPRKKAAGPVAPPTMAELHETLWKAADKLRGSMDAAQELFGHFDESARLEKEVRAQPGRLDV